MYQSKTFYKDLESNNKIVYDEQPSITFTSVQHDGTETNVNGYDYQTNFSFTTVAKGSFWITNIQYILNGENWNNNWPSQSVDGDGEYSYTGYCEYSKNSNTSHQAYYTIYLKNGNTMNSTNSLYFSGNPISSINLSGSPAASRAKVITRSRNNESGSIMNRCGMK